METIRQNGKTILYSNDGISIKMVFKNLTGRNFWRDRSMLGQHGSHKTVPKSAF